MSTTATTCFETDEQRWRAVVERNPRAAGEFFYSVRTTGVFCRPTCGARRPLRNNVAFHSTAEDARAGGFRPCRRCRPDEAPLSREWADAVARACRTIEQSADAPPVAALANGAAMSSSHFSRVFKQVTGLTPKAYAQSVRASRLRNELQGGGSIADAVYGAGFGSSSTFYAEADRILGMTPSSYRSGGAGVTVLFGVGRCSLGSILVAATERGVCAVLLGDDDGELAAELRRRFPRADLTPGDAEFEGWMSEVVALVEDPSGVVELPLDIRGTAFQHLVWQALRAIPPGSTASYAEVAAQIGRPRAVRAVAGACAANNLAVVIPCHRVVRSDNGISGYRWGVERKRELLRREASPEG
jgi:AraC family transcriptional regulator of adaptative response/methylated-DNA-[protein]-cysteine methyltransferase